MITPVRELPQIDAADLPLLKILCAAECYPEDTQVWRQDDCLLCLTDGDLILSGPADKEELTAFIGFLQPRRVFADLPVLEALGLAPKERLCILSRRADTTDSVFISEELSSRDVYRLLSVDGLELPPYELFAVDHCRRLNHGWAQYFAIGGKCAALSRHSGDFAYICGIASHEKGFGTVALNGILQKNHGRTVLVCCRPSVCGFYEKNGFSFLGEAGYWENEYGLFQDSSATGRSGS